MTKTNKYSEMSGIHPALNRFGDVIPFPKKRKSATNSDGEVKDVNKGVMAALDAKGKPGSIRVSSLLKWRQEIDRKIKQFEGKDPSPDLLCQDVAVDAAYTESLKKKLPRAYGRGWNFDAGIAAEAYHAAQKALVSFDPTKGSLRGWLYYHAVFALKNTWREHNNQREEDYEYQKTYVSMSAPQKPRMDCDGEIVESTPHWEKLATYDPDPLAQSELAPILERANLSSRDIDLLSDKFLEEMTTREMADKHGTSKSKIDRDVKTVIESLACGVED